MDDLKGFGFMVVIVGLLNLLFFAGCVAVVALIVKWIFF